MPRIHPRGLNSQYRSDPNLNIDCSNKLVPEYDAGGRGPNFQYRSDPYLIMGCSAVTSLFLSIMQEVGDLTSRIDLIQI